jgi:hypothetical protein
MAIAIALTLVFIALVAYGLQRNERRQTGPRPRLTGSPTVRDRDLERVRDELTALGGRYRSG